MNAGKEFIPNYVKDTFSKGNKSLLKLQYFDISRIFKVFLKLLRQN